MSIKKLINVEIRGKIVEIELMSTDEEELRVLNAYIDRVLFAEQEAETIKWYNNRIDYFIVMPQDDWNAQELSVLLKKLLGL